MGFGAVGEFQGTTQPSTGGGGGSGTVTDVSVATANGFAGTVATATTTPVITVKTTITGVLKGNGTAISAATAGTDYSAGTSALGTGILKSTTGTGALSIAVAGTDYLTPTGSGTGLTGVMLTSVYDPAGIDQQVVGTTATQTLTNKTLTAPVIATITNTGTLTLPTSTDTLVGRATTDTLTNKRITRRVLTLSAPATNPAIDTDNYDVVNITGLANALNITTALTGTPNPYDTLWFGIVDNGTAQTLSWSSNFEAATELPLLSLGSTSQQLDIVFWFNPNTSKFRCVGVTPGPIVLVTDISSTFAIPTTTGTVFGTALTLTPGTWDVEFFGIMSDTTGATGGQSASFGLVQSNTGGSATFTTKNGGTGNPKGVRVTTAVPFATEPTRAQVALKETLIVTAAGTMNVNCIAGAADLTLAATDSSLGYTTTLTYLRATLIG